MTMSSFYLTMSLISLFFRFQLCLRAGMKTTWVLSDEERKRRFSKFNKIKMQRSGKASQLPELFMVFTVEEKAALEDIGAKFQPQYCPTTWLTILMTINR